MRVGRIQRISIVFLTFVCVSGSSLPWTRAANIVATTSDTTTIVDETEPPLTEADLASVAHSDDKYVPAGQLATSDGPTLTYEESLQQENPTQSIGKAPMTDLTNPDAKSDGRYIVRVARGRSAAAVADELTAQGINAEVLTKHAMQTIIVDPNRGDLAKVKANYGVSQIWENLQVSLATEQINPPWGLDRIDQSALPLDNKFTYDSDGTGVTAYIVDTGTRGTHADFGGRVTSGWNGTTDPGGGNEDCHGHGTHVAGTVAGSTYGVAKNATIVPIRALTCSGVGYYDVIIAGIDWAIAQHQANTPAVMNMSIGGPTYTPLNDAVTAATNDGIVVVVAAGNSNANACNSSPASAPLAITVGATDSSDKKASFSNWGSCLDIWAPGVDVLSAYRTSDSATTTMSGTSMASPHVAGAVARLLSANSTLTPQQVTSIITTETVDVRGLNILQSPLFANDITPGEIAGLSASPRNGAAVISWNTPSSDTSGVEIALSNGTKALFGRGTTRWSVFGLTNGQSLTVTAKGIGSRGYGPSSTTTVTPIDDGSPDRPTITRIGAGDQWLNVEVQLPQVPTGGAITSVTVSAAPPTGSAITSSVDIDVLTTKKVIKVTGLTNLTNYTITATASNGSGSSQPSTSSTAAPGTAIKVSGTWPSIFSPTEVRAPMVLDERRGILWAGGVSRNILAIDQVSRLAASGTLPSGNGMWLFEHTGTGRVFAIPYLGDGYIYELDAVGSIVNATVVASPGFQISTAIIDNQSNEIIVSGSSTARYSIGASGSLTSLSVPTMSFNTDTATNISLYNSKVVLSSNLGGWVKIWNRDSSSVITRNGLSRPGTTFSYSSGILVSPTNNGPFVKVDWAGDITASVDLNLPIFSGGTFNGFNYSHRYADIVPFDNQNVGILLSDALISLRLSDLKVNAMGTVVNGAGGSLSMGAVGPMLAGAWAMDLDKDLRSRWKDYAIGSIPDGYLLNAAERIISEVTGGGIYVEVDGGHGVRFVEPASAPLDPVIHSANGSAHVTWSPPARITDAVSEANNNEYRLRPVTYDVLLQPGNIVRPWTGGPLDLVIDGLDPSVTYTATVRANSPGGIVESEPLTFTPGNTASIPNSPANLNVAASGDGCITARWNAVSSASSGYTLELRGQSQLISIAPGTTTKEVCGLVTTAGVFASVSARVKALNGTLESIPSAWSQQVVPTKMPLFEGHIQSAVANETLGITAAITKSVAASEDSSRRTALVIISDNDVRSTPISEGTPLVLGIDDVRREVIVASCNQVHGGIIAISLNDFQQRKLELPTSNQWEYCGSAWDPVRRAVWLAPTIYSSDDNFDSDGAQIVAVSVDTSPSVVASSILRCRPGTWNSSIYVAGYPRFTIENGVALASCMGTTSSSGKPEYSVVTNAVTGDVVTSSNNWVGAVGVTSDGYPITVNDSGVTVHAASPSVISFTTSLGYQSSSRGTPSSEADSHAPRPYRHRGNLVTVTPNSNQDSYLIDLSTSTSSRYESAAPRSNGTDLPSGNGVIQLRRSGVYAHIQGNSISKDTPSSPIDFVTITRTGQQVGMWMYSYSASPLMSFGETDLLATMKLRVPDNLGTPTDEIFYSSVIHIRPPISPTPVSNTRNSATWSSTASRGGLVNGTNTRWELNLPGSVVTTRDQSGVERCTNSSTSCTSAGNFENGAIFTSRTFSMADGVMFTSESSFAGLTAPTAPQILPWTPSIASQVAIRVGFIDSNSTSWQVSCSRNGFVISATGNTSGVASMSARPGKWACRSRGVNGNISGPWGLPIYVFSRTEAGVSAGLTVSSGNIAMSGTSGSFICSSGTTFVMGNAGQSVSATPGHWLCSAVLADHSSIPMSLVVGVAPSQPTNLSLSAASGRAILAFTLPTSSTSVDDSVDVTCTGANAMNGAYTSTRIDLGPIAPGATTCSVTRRFWLHDAISTQQTSTAEITSTLAQLRAVTLKVSGSGSVTSSVADLSTPSEGTISTNVLGGSVITFNAIANSGWKFSSWNIAGCSTSICQLTISEATSVEAIFVVDTPTVPLSPTTTVPAVTSTPNSSTTNSSATTTTPTLPISTTTTIPSVIGNRVQIVRAPSAAIATNTEIGVSNNKVMVLLQTPTSTKTSTQVTKYVILLKPVIGATISKTVSVSAGKITKPVLNGKSGVTYTLTVTAVTKSGTKKSWTGQKIKISK